MKKLRFGIIGCGLMGKEFASAISRWMHVESNVTKPEIVAVADTNINAVKWFLDKVPTVVFHTQNYQELLQRDDVDAIYCAVPHYLHEKIYIDIINAKKHLMGEKPFGIDLAANTKILEALEKNPEVFCRCCSQFPFYPAMKIFEEWILNDEFGKIIDVKSGFLHSSDMDINKKINWKRIIKYNGIYGCMGDLGMHIHHIPLRYGWLPKSLMCILSDIVNERPDHDGNPTKCDTYDNAIMLCRCENQNGDKFPITFETKRMSPGSINEWYIRVLGQKASAYFTTEDPGAFHYIKSNDNCQAWSRINVGYRPQFSSITGDIFEFGFTDAILQMWVSFMKEFDGEQVQFGCVRPNETHMSHCILTAAIRSQSNYSEERIEY